MTDTTEHTIPITAISRDVIHFISEEFPAAGLSQKILSAYAEKGRLPVTVFHNGTVHQVRKKFYDLMFLKLNNALKG